VRAGGEPLSDQAYDPRFAAGDRRWQFDKIDIAELSAFFFWFVVPVDTEEVSRMHVPKADTAQL
jgi:hypothetical protein